MGKGTKNIVFMGLTLGMIAFAVPSLDLRAWTSPGTIFVGVDRVRAVGRGRASA